MYQIFCDASIEPFQPNGIIAWAYIVKYKGEIIHQKAKTSNKGLGATNNLGEFQAVLASLLWLIKLPKNKQYPVIINSDSQLIVNQCLGKWDCKAGNLVPLYKLAKQAIKRYPKNILFRWIPREKNYEADALSRTVYDEKELEYFRRNKLNIIHGNDDISW